MVGVQPDENLRFLYICLKGSRDQIDWSTVAKTMNLNVPAARMRFRRLEEKIQTAMNEKANTVADADTDVHMAGTSTDGDGAGTGAGAGAGDTAKADKVKKPRGNKRKRTAKETDRW